MGELLLGGAHATGFPRKAGNQTGREPGNGKFTHWQFPYPRTPFLGPFAVLILFANNEDTVFGKTSQIVTIPCQECKRNFGKFLAEGWERRVFAGKRKGAR